MASFSIYPRKRKKGKPVFYVQFKKPDGTYTIAKSTGQTTRRDAEAWAENELLKNGAFLPGQQTTFTDYSRIFFD